MKRNLLLGSVLLASIAGLGFASAALDRSATAEQAVTVPTFEVDPMWPKPLPDHWILGSTIGVGIDSKDHVFIIHRGAGTLNERTEMGAATDPPTGECCKPAPPIVEFDADGNLISAWGGPADGYDWPTSNHGITIDDDDNVWIGGNGPTDSHILKFTHDGKFLAQFGAANQPVDSKNTEHFGRVAKINFDFGAHEAYVADGYGNKRVAVIDMSTGAVKRFWGAYGNVPDDENLGRYDPDAPLAQQFRNPVHCAMPSDDGLVYVCDRPNDRIQVFRKDGSFVKEARIAPRTLGDGSVWDITFSADPEQKFIFLADGKNERIYVIERASLRILTQFGDGGRQPGQFFAVHSIATDSRGNIYTTETYEGKRVQKFVYKGMGTVTKMDQGVLWPKR